MANPAIIRNRAIPGEQVRDPSTIENLEYSEKSGAKKVTEVGRALLPLGDGAGGFTTDASTHRVLPKSGANLAIYNNSGTAQAVTVGDSTMTAQAIGAVQSGANPFVGVACPPNSWTYLSTAQWNWVATNSASLIVYLIDDTSYIVVQPATNASNPQQTTAPSGAPVNLPNT